jgi:hypothetical protein
MFFVTYKWGKLITVIYYTTLKRFVRNKHSSLMGPFTSFEENEVFVNLTLGYKFTTLHFLHNKIMGR